MIVQPIPNFLGQYATFSDTLPVDDTTEVLSLTRPDGTAVNVSHAQLTRTINPDATVTYSWTQVLDQAGAWRGQFSSSGAAANVTAPIEVYVV